jgi:hypothetical protein
MARRWNQTRGQDQASGVPWVHVADVEGAPIVVQARNYRAGCARG